MRAARAIAMAIRVAGNNEGKGGMVAMMTTMAAALTVMVAGIDRNQLKATAGKKSDCINCDPTPAYYC